MTSRAAEPISAEPIVARSGAVDVVSIDTDVLLNNACAVLLTGEPSVLLDAIDAGTMVAVMSDQAFWEIGWMSAVSARGHGVSEADLRQLITAEYLPRIPVVSTGRSSSDDVRTHDGATGMTAKAAVLHTDDASAGGAGLGYWLPTVTDVRDQKDIAHVQVAQLVSATGVVSHDKHLRVPGYAPRTRPDFDQRIQHLDVVTTHRQHESATLQLISLTGTGTTWAVNRATALVGIRRGVAWAAIGVAAATAALWTLADAPRRQRLIAPLRPIVASVGDAYARAADARNALTAARLLTPTDPDKLEVRVASYLVRNRDTTMTGIAAELELCAAERRELSVLLQTHPAFEKVSRWGWATGRIRDVLETESAQSRRPRPALPTDAHRHQTISHPLQQDTQSVLLQPSGTGKPAAASTISRRRVAGTFQLSR